ncbi:MAG TPA: DUF427 domain-containing protein [Phenylobacterium sp.]|uniref:DUF427 domain-containing protein n=1 Tax=Phenylobacterium sp. TaxID=1871053 RepID=UPI002CE81896|nr:DUF427 domain-containing protein [Phenylobacterium sp.]HSV04400.1 DUF427 domain-containing protein [Phenylobacterium sp.]
MLKPGPDHPITLEPARTRWRAFFAGHVIADSDNALILSEAGYDPVVYFPREDVAMEYMSRQEKVTHCPYKGDASYYTILMDGEFAENAVWSYETPYEAMEPITGRLAFDRSKGIEVYPVDDAAVNPHHRDGAPNVDAVVQHTDAGDGQSQAERWEPNVETPGAQEGGVR